MIRFLLFSLLKSLMFLWVWTFTVNDYCLRYKLCKPQDQWNKWSIIKELYCIISVHILYNYDLVSTMYLIRNEETEFQLKKNENMWF